MTVDSIDPAQFTPSEYSAMIVRHLASLDTQCLQNLVQVDGVEPQMVGKSVDRRSTRIAQKVAGQIAKRRLDLRFPPP